MSLSFTGRVPPLAPVTAPERSSVCTSESGSNAELEPLESRLSVLAVLSAGAYGMTMSSNYNTRPRAAEVMVDGEAVYLIRARENAAALFADERLIG